MMSSLPGGGGLSTELNVCKFAYYGGKFLQNVRFLAEYSFLTRISLLSLGSIFLCSVYRIPWGFTSLYHTPLATKGTVDITIARSREPLPRRNPLWGHQGADNPYIPAPLFLRDLKKLSI